MKLFLKVLFTILFVLILSLFISKDKYIFVLNNNLRVYHNDVLCDKYCKVNKDEEIEIIPINKDNFTVDTYSFSALFLNTKRKFKMPANNLYIFADYKEGAIVFDTEVIHLQENESRDLGYHFINLEKGLYNQREIQISNYDDNIISFDGKSVKALKPGYSYLEAFVDGVKKRCYVIVKGDEDYVGKVSIVSKFSYDDFFSELNFGHSFIIFEAYQDIELSLDNYFLSFIPSEKYKELSLNNPDALLFSNVDTKDKKLYADSLLKPEEISSLSMSKGDIATFGQTSLSDSLTVTLESIFNSNIFNRYSFFGSSFTDLRSLFIQVDNFIFNYLYDGFNNQLANNGISSSGGHSLNYELHRQAEYMSFTPNNMLSIEVTDTELRAMIDFINNYGGYSTLNQNCTTMAVSAFNIVSSKYPELYIKNDFFDSPVFLMSDLRKMKDIKLSDRLFNYEENRKIFKPSY